MSVKKRTKRKALKADIVYDDDSSSSSSDSESENLEAFRKSYVSQDNTDSRCSSDADDESNESSSDDSVSTGEEDGEHKCFGHFETPTEKPQITLGATSACINPKVDKLRSQLQSIRKATSKCTQGGKGNLSDHRTKLTVSVNTENMIRGVGMPVQEVVAESPTKKIKWAEKRECSEELPGKSSESYEDKERVTYNYDMSILGL